MERRKRRRNVKRNNMKKNDKLEEAKKILAEDMNKKRAECQKEIQAVLEKYGMQLSITPVNIVLQSKK